MKTDSEVSGPNFNNPVIWTTDDVELPHLTTEECLPVIGGSQVSSILSTLDTPENIPAKIELAGILSKPPQIDPVDIPKQKTIKTNKNLTYIICDLCPFLCLKSKKITEHTDLVHKNKKPSLVFELKCPACTNIFFHKLSLQAHLTYDHCVSNSADVAKIIQVALHTKVSTTYTNKLSSDDIDINRTPIIIEELDAIEEKITTPEPIVPPKIPKRQNSVTKFLDDKKLHKCTVANCKVRMQSLDKMNYHITCHIDTIFKCIECNEMFSLWKALTGHLWRSHKLDMELHKCDKCDYRTHSLSKLNNTHKLIHGSHKGFTCDVCEKSFKNAKQLRNHKDTHKKTGVEVNYQCEECPKSFTNKNQLRIHTDGVHKKLKPYLCSFCGYKGATRGALKMHIRQHTGEKPFTCDLCEYTTADHNSLRRHKLRHSGEKPYKCAHCDYQCIQSSTYKVHIKTKHPGLDKDLLFACPSCQFRSISKDVYNSHVSSQHPELRAS